MAIKLSKQQQQYLAIGVVMAGAFGYVYFRFFWTPTTVRIKKAEDEIAKVEDDIAKAKRATARMADIEKELELLHQQDAENQKSLPKTNSVPELLVKVNELAQKNNVTISNFAPGAKSTQPLFIQLNYPMSIKGTFHNIGRFLASLALEERIYNETGISFPAPDGSTGEMAISFTLITYQYKG